MQTIAQQETLQYLFDDINDQIQPTITAAFWGDGDAITAREPWAKVVEHGAHMIAHQTLPLEDAIAEWTQEYGLVKDQITLLRTLFTRWIASASPIVITAEERKILTAQGDAGLAEARKLLAIVGIECPSLSIVNASPLALEVSGRTTTSTLSHPVPDLSPVLQSLRL